MSREFGSYTNSGYLHGQIQYAAEDCKQDGTDPTTFALGKVLEALYPIAYAVCAVEAGDSSVAQEREPVLLRRKAVTEAVEAMFRVWEAADG